MEQQNLSSTVTEFVLLGLTQSPEIQQCLFIIFFIAYLTTWVGNVTIIIAMITEHQLPSMYFLLANLAFLGVSDSSVTAPKLLLGLLSQHRVISFNECILQIFFFHFFAGAAIFVLVLMAVDQYVAIYKPFHYLNIINQGVCVGLVAGAWMGGLAHSIVQIALVLQLPFCGPNILDNFYCDVPQVIKLACTDTYLVELLMVSKSGMLIIVMFISLLISYTIILVKIKKHVTDGKRKALSTCGTQITVVCLQFIPSTFIYARPFWKFPMDKLASVFFTLITSMMNAMSYTLKNAEMKKAIRKLMRRIFFSQRKL
ncbi:olfactory receptor 4D9-like [Gopherus evgoodei]|uniref:olfactory receptor 4D9-like n=1 Tax=Gopherus evgoodei TaxID=1825980 RepID=UPI0011D01973|nr:olfactory receptor 4D9-like [Gopherus evgoodei]